MKKVVIAGGTGFIGSYIARRFRESGYEVLIVSRSPGHVSWEPMVLEEAVNNSELVINLAGKSVNCRHTDENKKELIDSRIEPTIWIGNAIQTCEHPPKLWINASGSGIYKPSTTHAAIEEDNKTGTDFMSNLVELWEKTFFGFELRATRQIALRTSVVLGKNGGALKPLVTLSKLGLGGKQASGHQIVSWIHIEDYFRILLFVLENDSISGAVNCTSPQPVTNKIFQKKLREALHAPFGIPAPKFAIQLGVSLINTEASLILNSSYLIPKRLMDANFEFSFPEISKALESLVG